MFSHMTNHTYDLFRFSTLSKKTFVCFPPSKLLNMKLSEYVCKEKVCCHSI